MNNTDQTSVLDLSHESSDKRHAFNLHIAGFIIATTGIVLDSMTLHVIRVTKLAVRQAVVISLINLCVADLLLVASTALINIIAFIESYSIEMPLARRMICANEVAQWLWSTAIYSNLLTLVIMAVEQFVCIRWPLFCNRWLSSRRLCIFLASAWLISLAVSFLVPAAVVAANTVHQNIDNWPIKGTTRFCYQYIVYNARDEGLYIYSFRQQEADYAQRTLGIVLVSIVFVVLVVTYCYMFTVVRSIIRREAAHNSLKAAAKSSHPWRGSRRITLATFAVTVLFLAYYLPLFVYNVLVISGTTPTSVAAFPAFLAVSSLTAITDPLVYAWRLKEVRGGFYRLFGRNSRGQFTALDRNIPLTSGHLTLPATTYSADAGTL